MGAQWVGRVWFHSGGVPGPSLWAKGLAGETVGVCRPPELVAGHWRRPMGPGSSPDLHWKVVCVLRVTRTGEVVHVLHDMGHRNGESHTPGKWCMCCMMWGTEVGSHAHRGSGARHRSGESEVVRVLMWGTKIDVSLPLGAGFMWSSNFDYFLFRFVFIGNSTFGNHKVTIWKRNI